MEPFIREHVQEIQSVRQENILTTPLRPIYVLFFFFDNNVCLNYCRRIVCLAIQDEAWRFGRYYKYILRRLHLKIHRFSYRSSFAGCGYVGRRPYWIRSMSRHQRRGPSYVNIRIPLSGGKFIALLGNLLCFIRKKKQ